MRISAWNFTQPLLETKVGAAYSHLPSSSHRTIVFIKERLESHIQVSQMLWVQDLVLFLDCWKKLMHAHSLCERESPSTPRYQTMARTVSVRLEEVT